VTRISSRFTGFNKKIFPALWFGFLAFFLVASGLGGAYREDLLFLIKNRREEDMIALSNIMNVNVTTYMNPPRITLRLVKPSKFGSEISFSPITGFKLNPFAKNEVAEDLIVRVDQARSRRAV
jgi:hypothetical protein